MNLPDDLRSFDPKKESVHLPQFRIPSEVRPRVMSESTVAVSAPGKVLFAGGYLVLDRQHTGLVFGLDARIHVHVRWHPHNDHANNQISVGSPQFGARWAYGFSTSDGHVDVHPQ